MSVNRKIEECLRDEVSNIWPLCCPEDSKPATYIVYNPELESAESFSDDEDEEWIHYMQIHLFTKGNYVTLRKNIRKKLRDAGFVMTNIETFYESDTGYNHLCFECWIEEEP